MRHHFKPTASKTNNIRLRFVRFDINSDASTANAKRLSITHN